MTSRLTSFLKPRQRLALGGTALLVLGAAGGAGAVSLTRPTPEMAPTVPTAVSRLAMSKGIVTVRGRVAEVYGDRFTVQDATGKALVDTGPRHGATTVQAGSPVLVQGRFDNGQLHARYLVDASGTVQEMGPPPPPPGRPDAPPPPSGGPGAAPPPPGAAAPPPTGAGAPPPPAPALAR